MKDKPERYDWVKDLKQFKIDGHVPFNRCFFCGHRFIGSSQFAFCNICDNYMSKEAEEVPMYVVTCNEKGEGKKEGYWTTRNKLVATRIRIPEDVLTEEEYKKRLEFELKRSEYTAEFRRANQ